MQEEESLGETNLFRLFSMIVRPSLGVLRCLTWLISYINNLYQGKEPPRELNGLIKGPHIVEKD